MSDCEVKKPDSGAVCLAAYRAKPVVPVLHDRCVHNYDHCMLVERFVLTEIKTIIIIIIIIIIITVLIICALVIC